jgi:hypothetical protein
MEIPVVTKGTYLIVLGLDSTSLGRCQIAFHGGKIHILEEDMETPKGGHFLQSRNICVLRFLVGRSLLLLLKVVDSSDKCFEKVSEALDFCNANDVQHVLIESLLEAVL